MTISIKTQNDNKINVSCSANQQNVTLNYMLNMTINTVGTLNLSTWFDALVFFLHLLRCLNFFLKKYVLRSPCWIQSALRLFMFYTIFISCIATYRFSVTLRNYQPVAWVLYQRVIDQSKADMFIKPGIIKVIYVPLRRYGDFTTL